MAKKENLKGKSSGPNETLQRSILPIPDPQFVGLTTYDAKDPESHSYC